MSIFVTTMARASPPWVAASHIRRVFTETPREAFTQMSADSTAGKEERAAPMKSG